MNNTIPKIIRNPLKTVLHTIVAVFTAIPITVLLFILINLVLSDWDYDGMYYFGYRPTLIITESMEPNIRVNGIVVIKDEPYENVKIGDIVRYTNYQGISVVHRVVDKQVDLLLTKGDNNSELDPYPVRPDEYNGKIVGIYNNYSTVITKLIGKVDVTNGTKSLFRAFIGLIGLALIISFILIIIYDILDFLLVNYYWYYGKDKMQDSIAWLDKQVTKEQYNNIIENYKSSFKKANVIDKVKLRFKLYRYYDNLRNEEKKAKKSLKSKDILQRCIDKYN